MKGWVGMGILGMADPSLFSADALTGLVYAIIKILAYGAIGIVFAGIVLTCWCDLFESKKWRRCQGRTEVWRLMH
jgi:hypothetical protein